MYSTQILSSISFNLTIPMFFLTIMQLNLITITTPFIASLICMKNKVCKELNQVEHEKFIFFKSLTSLQFLFIIIFSFDYHITVLLYYYYFFFWLPHISSFSLLFFSFDYHISISFPFHFYRFNNLCRWDQFFGANFCIYLFFWFVFFYCSPSFVFVAFWGSLIT